MFFVRTGADTMWETPDYCWKYPFFSPEAGEYMVEEGVKIIDMDAPGSDASLRSGFRKNSPLHLTLPGNDVLIIENLANLKSVCGRVTAVYAVPIKVAGAYGAPARVLAKDLDA